MPGARYKDFRLGDGSELLAEFILNSMAFTTRVPRQEDIGHDFFCVLAEHDRKMIKAGPFFTVQVKRGHRNVVFEKDYEIEWIQKQENPFFVCIVNRDSHSVDIYSTWNMHNGFLAKHANKVILIPGGPNDTFQEVQTEEDRSKQEMPLGKPILHIDVEDVMNENRVNEYAGIFREWVVMDRENVVNRHAGMYWIVGPKYWETNQSLSKTKEWMTAFYWNAQNLQKCQVNFGRSATALRLVTQWAYGLDGEKSQELTPEIESLEQVIKTHSKYLEPLAKQVLRNEIKMEI